MTGGLYKVEKGEVVALPSTMTHYSTEVGVGLANLEIYEERMKAYRSFRVSDDGVSYSANLNSASKLWLEVGTIHQLRRDFIGIYGPGMWWENVYAEDRIKNPLEYVISLKSLTKGVREKAIKGGSIPLGVIQSLYSMYLDMRSKLGSRGEHLEEVYLENRWSELMFDLRVYTHVSRWWGEEQRVENN